MDSVFGVPIFVQDLASSQKEGDILRGDLLANQNALADLNVYADSLRSR